MPYFDKALGLLGSLVALCKSASVNMEIFRIKHLNWKNLQKYPL